MKEDIQKLIKDYGEACIEVGRDDIRIIKGDLVIGYGVRAEKMAKIEKELLKKIDLLP